MSSVKQSLAWWCFADKMTPDRLVQAAADIGYAGVELAHQTFWPLARKHGLAITSMVGHRSIVAGLNRREHHDRIIGDLTANIWLAAEWRIPTLICFSGNRDGLDDEQGAAITAEGLRRIAPMAQDAGVTLVLELLNSKVDHPDYQADRTAWGVAVCDLVASPRVKLLYDIYHMQVMEGDIIRTIQQNHSYFAHYHTAGNPGRHELDATQELNYAAIFRAICDTGYAGYITHEFIPLGEPEAGLKAAFDLCQQNFT